MHGRGPQGRCGTIVLRPIAPSNAFAHQLRADAVLVSLPRARQLDALVRYAASASEHLSQPLDHLKRNPAENDESADWGHS